MLTKLRSLPCSLYRCALRPECFAVRSASSSPTVAPAASTASSLSVYGRSGVGMRIFAMLKTALFETRTIVLQKPHGHVPRRRALAGRIVGALARQAGGRAGDRDDDVRKRRPRVIEVVLRRPRRMIRMRVVEPEQLGAQLGGPPLGFAVVGRAHEKAAPRPLLRRIRERHDRGDLAVTAEERPTAFVGIGFLAVRANRLADLAGDR